MILRHFSGFPYMTDWQSTWHPDTNLDPQIVEQLRHTYATSAEEVSHVPIC